MNRFISITGGTASHSTWLPAEGLLAGHPNDGNHAAGYKPLMWFMALLLAVFVAGCGGNKTPSESIAPTVSSTAPADAATGIALNANITATFSEAMYSLTVSTATFTLKQGNTDVPGAVTYVGTIATFNPASNLVASTVYTATVTTGVKDLVGNALAVTKTWSFTTGTTADNAAPTVLSTIPADAGTGAVNANITAAFDEAMDPLTFTTTTFTLMQGTTVVPGAVSYVGNIATFNPASDLLTSTPYTATITTGVMDLAGNALAVTKTWSFTSSATADTIAPTVSSTIPLDVATGVAVNANITATFDEAMDPLTITNLTFTLAQGVTPVPGAVTSPSTTTATFNPNSNLAPSTPYTATISTGVKDLAGNAMVATKTWGFTTAAAGITTVLPGLAGSTGAAATNPTVISSSPTNGDINVPTSTNSKIFNGANNTITGKLITATFSEAMTAGTITPVGTFTLWDNTAASIVSGTVTMNVADTMGNAANRVATFTPSAALIPSHIYTATITTAAQTSAANAPITNTVEWSFTTGVAFTGQAPVDLLSIASNNFVILANTQITDANPTAATASITGNIALATITGAGNISTTCLDSMEPGWFIHERDAGITDTCFVQNSTLVAPAELDRGIAYVDAGGRTNPAPVAMAADISGMTLTPGIYNQAGAVVIYAVGTNADPLGITLDCQGDANAVFIFQTGPLTLGLPATPAQISLIGSCQAKNVFWAATGDVTITPSSVFRGNILTATQAVMQLGAVLHGRALAATAVTLIGNTVAP